MRCSRYHTGMVPTTAIDIDRLQQLLDDSTESDYDWVTIGKEIGARNLLVVLDLLGGQKPHVPYASSLVHRLERAYRDRSIRRRYTGNNLEVLAQDFHLSTRQIREIVRTRPRTWPRRPDPMRPAKLTETKHNTIADFADCLGVPQCRALDVLLDAALASPEVKAALNRQLNAEKAA